MPSIKADHILDNWMTIVENASGQGERIYSMLDTELTRVNVPQVTWSKGNRHPNS